jgi:4-hydroxy-L-threonine phosphate dehydrogenase PdxA
MKRLPKIAFAMGDPAVIGPELAVRAATNPSLRRIADITVYGCSDIVTKASAKFAGCAVFADLWTELAFKRGCNRLSARDNVIILARIEVEYAGH